MHSTAKLKDCESRQKANEGHFCFCLRIRPRQILVQAVQINARNFTQILETYM